MPEHRSSNDASAIDLILPVTAYLLLAVSNAKIIPWFEYPDEKNHIHYAQFLARERRLPPLRNERMDDSESTVRVAFNPPLYYWLAALFLRGDGPFISPTLHWHPLGPRGFSQPPVEGWAPHERLLSRLPALRGLSICFGLITVMSCFLIARRAASGNRLLAAGMAWVPVLIPQFVSMSAAINNEGAATAFLTLSAAFAVGRKEAAGCRSAVLAGLAFALSLLCKISGLALAPAIGYLLWCGKGAGHRTWRRLVAGSVLAAVLVSPWILRNLLRVGDPTAMSVPVYVTNPNDVGAFPHQFTGVMKGIAMVFCTLYAWYGQLAVRLPIPVYLIPLGVVALALWGWTRLGWRGLAGQSGLPTATGLAIACEAIAWLAYNLRVFSPQGRYLFVAMPFLSYWIVRGLLAATRREWTPRSLHATGVVLALLQGALLWGLVAPAYGR